MQIAEGVLAQLLLDTEVAVNKHDAAMAFEAFQSLAEGSVAVDKYFDHADIFGLLYLVMDSVESGAVTLRMVDRPYFIRWHKHLMDDAPTNQGVIMLRARFIEFHNWVLDGDWSDIPNEW